MTTKFDTRIGVGTADRAAQYGGSTNQTESVFLHIIAKEVSNVVEASSSSPKNVIEIAPSEWSRKSSEQAEADDTDEDLPFDADEELGPDDFFTEADIDREIAQYEQMYGMSSDEFLLAWKNGTAPDTFETNSWAMLLDFKRR